jgi:hypothetical protein
MPWSDLKEALLPGGVLKSGYVARLLEACAHAACTSLLYQLAATAAADPADPLIDQATSSRSVIDDAADITTPTFLLQGRRDYLFPPEQTIDLYRQLPGPKRLYIGLLGNPPATNPPGEVPYELGEMLAWFDHYLLGVDNGIQNRPPVEYAADPDPVTPGSTTARFDPRATTSFSSVQQGRDRLTLYPDAGGVLLQDPPTGDETPDTIATPGDDPNDPSQGVAFTSSLPTTDELAIRGRPTITLPLASSDGFTHVICELWWQKGSRTALFGWGTSYFEQPLAAEPRMVTLDSIDVVADIPAGAFIRAVFEGSTNPVYSSWFASGFDHPNPPGTHLDLYHSAGAQASITLPVASVTPPPSLAVRTAVRGDIASLRAGANGAKKLSWSFGDGTHLAQGHSVRHRYASGGLYAGTVTAYSSAGAASTVTFKVRVP